MAGLLKFLIMTKVSVQTPGEMVHYFFIISMSLLICKITLCDSGQFRDCLRNNAKPSVNILNNVQRKIFEQSQQVNIAVDEISVKLENGQTYSRQLKFTCFGVVFVLFMRRHSLFHKDILLNVGDQTYGKYDVKRYIPVLYVGVMDKSINSDVYGEIVGEQFELIIQLQNKTFSVECPYHRSDDTKSTRQLLRLPIHDCQAFMWHSPKLSQLVSHVDSCDSETKKYKDFLSKTMPKNVAFEKEDNKSRRQRRSISSFGVTGNCVLKLVADHLYFEHVGKGDIDKTIAEMALSVAEADLIFRQSDFNGDGVGDNIGFLIGNITIYRRFQNYNMKDENLDVYEYLDKFSEYDFSAYCLGIAYTYRDFEDSVVGLAWVGSSNNNGPAGGICQRRLWYLPDRKYYSYNTALMTQLSNGQYLPSYSSGLILAHEFGHSFGSSHDVKTDPICSPGGTFGNYLMHPYTSDGNLANHRRFSSCSINAIYPVLVNKSPGCFQEDLGPVCGNGIVEDGEECDCGSVDMCSEIDPCCTPENNPSPTSDFSCSIRRSQGYQCSPKTAACCTQACQYHDSSDLPICRQMKECTSTSTCETGSSSCPDAVSHPDGTTCDSGRKVCFQGRCSRSICTSLGLMKCQCSKTIKDACYVCCTPTNVSGYGCSPISSYSSDIRDILNHKGDACYNYNGFCDEAGQCILKESDTLDDLNKFLSEETVINIGVWFKKYWYYVIVGIIFTTILAFTVSVFFRPKRDDHVDAMRLGKLSAVMAQARVQKACYKEKMEDCEVAFQKLIEQIKTQQSPMALTQAVARMSVFFPTAPLSLLMKSVQSSSSEEFAVKMLLVRDYPIQRFSISVKDEDEKTTPLGGVREADSP